MNKQRKAVALVSGGLDSMLAVKVIQEQGIHVEGLNFFTGFCVEGHTHAIRKIHADKPKRNTLYGLRSCSGSACTSLMWWRNTRTSCSIPSTATGST